MRILTTLLIRVLDRLRAGHGRADDGRKPAPPRGEEAGDYNVVQSWEFGYRFASIGGDEGKYRSDVNYRDGVRLLGSYLTVNSKDGHGRWFDEIVLTHAGAGQRSLRIRHAARRRRTGSTATT